MKYTRQFKNGSFQYVATNSKGESRVVVASKNRELFDRKVKQYHDSLASERYVKEVFSDFLSNPSHVNVQEMIDAMASYQMSKGIRDV